MNNNTIIGYHSLGSSYGYYFDKIPRNVLNELTTQINHLSNNFNQGKKANDGLIGEIEHEYLITPQPLLTQYVKELTNKLESHSKYIESYYENKTLEFNSCWVNFQKKYEYNPIHNHRGVFSFVIWYQIPFLNKDEQEYSYKTNKEAVANGNFHFITPILFNKNNNIASHPLNIDKSLEGHIAIFPSNLNHIVYPFYTSNEYRITVAGNINESNI